ncbi:MAG: hypothetical protein H6742_05860 [Alphaproteobacteria bacterium]|nr:hypothetical protein [Alphaproteobacteria bacterium]
MTPARWTALVTALLVLGLLTLFVVQNLQQTTDLYLDLWVWAGHFKQPLPVPLLLLGTFCGGLLVGAIWGLAGRMTQARRVEQLEQDLARASLRSTSGYGGGSGGSAGGASSVAADDGWT